MSLRTLIVTAPHRVRRNTSYSTVKRYSTDRFTLNEELNSALVRSKGKFLRSPAQALALVRTMERRYGSIREFRFLRDFEHPTIYQLYMNVAFSHPESFQRIPTSPKELKVRIPLADSDRPGGVGLDELEPYFQAEDSKERGVPSFAHVMRDVNDTDGNFEEANFTIERANSVWYTPATRSSNSSVMAISRNFVKWGGFHDLQPIPSNIESSDLFNLSAVDGTWMKAALKLHRGRLKLPYAQARSQLEWRPLPGHESAPTDTPMPSLIQALYDSEPSGPADPEATESV